MTFMNKYLKTTQSCNYVQKKSAFGTLANYFTNFWMTASRFFAIEPAHCERDENHEFDNFKTIPY